ncbi:HINT domain-containing protein [Pendulispora rubella]|uniref:HINT domain-containing protein n=1 Tax=Pendulispora rubella TaxID=2741070 RepID=A0ABZ2KPF6_9BACT
MERLRFTALMRIVRDSRGVSAIEYGLLLVAILLLVAGGYRALGKRNAQTTRVAETTFHGGADYTPPSGGGGGDTICDGRSCGGPGACFVAGTLVATPSGERPIESLHAGELVFARGEFDDAVTARAITKTFVRPAPSLVDVHVVTPDDARESVRSTPDHLYFARDRGWTAAAELTSGETLVDRTGHEVRVTKVVRIAQEAPVYNFEVDVDHTYFVGHTAVWVHNPPGCGDPPAGGSDPAGGSTGSPGTSPPPATGPPPITGPVFGGMAPGATPPAHESIPAPSDGPGLIGAEQTAQNNVNSAQQKVNTWQTKINNVDAPGSKVPDDKKDSVRNKFQEKLNEEQAKLAKEQAKLDAAHAAAEAAHIHDTLNRIDHNNPPSGVLGQQWGVTFNNTGRPPASDPTGTKIPDLPLGGSYKEYRVNPGPGDNSAGGRRIVIDTKTGDVYYSRTHYGDHGDPAFVKIAEGDPRFKGK